MANSSLTNVEINGNPSGDSSPLGESVPNPGQEQAKGPDPVSLSQGNPPGSHPGLCIIFWEGGRVYAIFNSPDRGAPSHLPSPPPPASYLPYSLPHDHAGRGQCQERDEAPAGSERWM